jgi:hypothetical protein
MWTIITTALKGLNVASWFTGVRLYLMIGAVGALVAVYWNVRSFINEYDARGTQIAALKKDATQYQARLRVAESQKNLDTAAIAAASDRIVLLWQDIDRTCRILADVKADQTPGTDDKVGAPVDRVLDELQKLEERKKK